MPNEEYDPKGGGIVFTPTIEESLVLDEAILRNKKIKRDREVSVKVKELLERVEKLEQKNTILLEELYNRITKLESIIAK